MLFQYIKKRIAAKKALKHSKLLDRELRCSPSRRNNYLYITGNGDGHLKLFVQLIRLLDENKYGTEKVSAGGDEGLIEWRRKENPAVWEEQVEWNRAKLRLVALPCDSGNNNIFMLIISVIISKY